MRAASTCFVIWLVAAPGIAAEDWVTLGNVVVTLGMPEEQVAQKLTNYELIRRPSGEWTVQTSDPFRIYGYLKFKDGKLCQATQEWSEGADTRNKMMKALIGAIRNQGERTKANVKVETFRRPGETTDIVTLEFADSGRTIMLLASDYGRVDQVGLREIVGTCADSLRLRNRDRKPSR